MLCGFSADGRRIYAVDARGESVVEPEDAWNPAQRTVSLDLTAPSPRMANGKPDFSGLWRSDTNGTTETVRGWIERYRRPDFRHLELSTLNDPGALVEPRTVPFKFVFDADTEQLEYVCDENERDHGHLAGKASDRKGVESRGKSFQHMSAPTSSARLTDPRSRCLWAGFWRYQGDQKN
jgi:hypothetical protein